MYDSNDEGYGSFPVHPARFAAGVVVVLGLVLALLLNEIDFLLDHQKQLQAEVKACRRGEK